MKSALKILAGLAVTFILLLVIAGILLPIIYDKEDLKNAIASEVYGQTGRELTIKGDLDFSVFPWIALEVSDLSLGNAAGFGDQPQAKIGRARAGVALMPLFQRQISIDEITLDGLELNLLVDEKGRNNWDDLSNSESTAQTGGESLFSSQRIAGLSIRDANVEYVDKTAGSHYRLVGFSLKAGALGEGKPLPLSLESLIEDVTAGTRANVQLMTIAAINLDTGIYTLDDLELEIALEADGSSGQSFRIQAPRLDLDLTAETLNLETFVLRVADLRADGSLSAINIMGDTAYSGSLEITDFSPADLMQDLQLAIPETTDSGVLRHAALRTEFSGGTNQLRLTNVSMELEQSRVSGYQVGQKLEQPQINLKINQK
jgi:AsmA protein